MSFLSHFQLQPNIISGLVATNDKKTKSGIPFLICILGHLHFTSLLRNFFSEKEIEKKTSNMTANLTHSILCVMLPKQHLEPKSQVPQLWLMAPDDKKASVLHQHQKQWRIRVGVYGLWTDLGEAEVQASGFLYIRPSWQMAYSWPESKDLGHPVNFPWLHAVDIPDVQAHKSYWWLIWKLFCVRSEWVFIKVLFINQVILFSTLPYNYHFWQHRTYVL